MKATLILADAATTHPDGTFSLLRGGINRVHAPGKPIMFKGALVARIVGNPSEAGSHEFKIACIDADGQTVAPDLTGTFELPPPGGATQIALNMQLALPNFGRYEFCIVVDRSQLDTWPLEAVKAEPRGKP